jgi:hypothetical protein
MTEQEGSRQELLTVGIRDTAVDLIGLGMHGSWTALVLARMGVPKLRLWDGDVVSLGNMETQCYNRRDIGKPKPKALTSWLRALGYTGEVIGEGEWHSLAADCRPVVICCADSMEVRKDAVLWASAHGAKYYIESRSAGHDAFIHAFRPNKANYDKYIANYFPAVLAQVACGATGTIAMGMQVASVIGSLLALTRGGEDANLIPGDHEIHLGLGHIAKMFRNFRTRKAPSPPPRLPQRSTWPHFGSDSLEPELCSTELHSDHSHVFRSVSRTSQETSSAGVGFRRVRWRGCLSNGQGLRLTGDGDRFIAVSPNLHWTTLGRRTTCRWRRTRCANTDEVPPLHCLAH